ncbi:NAD(P)-binding domain-containing protein [Limosilactobacillus reuteri]|nr:NAD(P)-binding domain-containing protein [Limosilactobacillus reuteri]
MRKIGIIGPGHVGEMLANQLVMNGKVDELVLIDEKDQLAIAIQADLNDAQFSDQFDQILAFMQNYKAPAHRQYTQHSKII